MGKISSSFIIMMMVGFCFLSFFTVENVEADTIYADASFSGFSSGNVTNPFNSIQDAINAANDSDIILVKAGSYLENIVVNKSVRLLGEDKENTIIDGGFSADSVLISADDVVFSNFTVVNGSSSGINVFNVTNVEINNCLVGFNQDNGLYVKNSSDIDFYENDVYNNSCYGVMIVNDSFDNVFYHNNFYNNGGAAFSNSSSSWYMNSFIGGNYWDGHNLTDIDGDGFADTVYNVTGGEDQDLYPLINMWPYNLVPVANFSWVPEQPTIFDDIQLVDTSFDVISNEDIISWYWDFNSNGTVDSYDQIPGLINFSTKGNHLVTLTVEDSGGLNHTVSKNLTIFNTPPEAVINVAGNSHQINVDVQFDAFHSNDPDGNIAAYHWDLDDDKQYDDSTADFAQKSWPSAGTFTIGLKVVDDDGAEDTDSISITVTDPNAQNQNTNDNPGDTATNPPPVIDEPQENKNPSADAGGPYYGLIDEKISFDGAGSSDSDGVVVSYNWIFGDGSTGTGSSPTHTYKSAGEYTVNLMILDDDGGSGSDSAKVVVSANPNNPPEVPVVSAPLFAVSGDVVDFVFNCSDSDGDDLKYYVSWGDGDSSVSDWVSGGLEFVLNHSYAAAGFYTVEVYVSDDKTVSVTVNYTIGIEQMMVSDVGVLFDGDSDGVFDSYEDTGSNVTSDVVLDEGGLYLIDVDDDGVWDYTFDAVSGDLNEYVVETDDEGSGEFLTTSVSDGDGSGGSGMLILLGVILAVGVGVFLFWMFYLRDRLGGEDVAVGDFNGGVGFDSEEELSKLDDDAVVKPDISAVISAETYGAIDEIVKDGSDPVDDSYDGVVRDMKDLEDKEDVIGASAGDSNDNIISVGDTDYCAHCGGKIDPGHAFCIGCGKKIK